MAEYLQRHPGWLKKSTVLSTFEIGWRRLESWRLAGFVRTVKLEPETRNSRRLYSAADLERVLSSLAAGRAPRRATGRTTR